MRRLPTSVVRRAVQVGSRPITAGNVPFDVQRRRYDALSALTRPPWATRVAPETVAGIPCERVTARAADPTRCVVHVHGGGFCIGSPRAYRSFAGWLSRATGVSVVLPAYRLAPEHPYPAAPDDATAVWRELADQAAGLSGDSAGGHLAIEVALRMRDGGGPMPAALVLISPAVTLGADRRAESDPARRDIMLRPDWSERCEAAYAPAPEVRDLAAVDLNGLPRTLVVAGTDELLLRDADQFSGAARAAGVDVTDIRGSGMWHVYPTQAGTCREADDAVADIARFLME